MKLICLDMDGTIADLYSVEGWLEMLRNEDTTPYREAKPIFNMASLATALEQKQRENYKIAIVTALAKYATPAYKQAIRQAKREWLAEWGIPFDFFHGIDYNASKRDTIRSHMPMSMANLAIERMFDPNVGEAILVDDEARHRDTWGWGRTIDPTAVDLIEALHTLK